MKPKVTVQINEGGLEYVYRQVAEKIKAVDKEIRAVAAGKTVDEVVTVARERFSQIGLSFPDKTLRDYASSVASGGDFRFVLQ